MGKQPRDGRRPRGRPAARPWHCDAFLRDAQRGRWYCTCWMHFIGSQFPPLEPPCPRHSITSIASRHRHLDLELGHTRCSIRTPAASAAEGEPRNRLGSRLNHRGWLQRGNASGQTWTGMTARSLNVTTAGLHGVDSSLKSALRRARQPLELGRINHVTRLV